MSLAPQQGGGQGAFQTVRYDQSRHGEVVRVHERKIKEQLSSEG